MLRLADAPVLPFEFADYATTIRKYVDEIDKDRKAHADAPALDLDPLRKALDRLERNARKYDRALIKVEERDRLDVTARAQQLVRLNRLVYTSERAFAHPPGLPRREWFKHLIYAPGFYTGYGVKTLPGIREGIEQKAWDEAKRFVPIVTSAIDRLSAQVDEATSALRAALD
jgi:N-acetylated-alpha-linked acidic dipeptidase